jgi:hypothetical protein
MSQSERGKLGPNDPCWCGSGKKFKKCHRDREGQQALEYHHFAENLKKTREGEKRCLYPLKGSCPGKVIRAHSIAKSSALHLIARDGKVYQPNVDPYAIAREEGVISHQLVGVNLATTFSGFCSRHDHELFKLIDCDISRPTHEQLFLLHYRALCRELYVKRPTLISNASLREADRGRSEGFQKFLQQVVAGSENSIDTSLRELEVEKSECDQMLDAGSFRGMKALVLHFDELPTIACSGHTQPIFDFSGSELQSLADLTNPLAKLSFTLLPAGTGGIAVLAWLDKWNIICKQFADSLTTLPDKDKCPAIVQWVFDSFENHAFQPDWWESLDKSAVSELQTIGLNWTPAVPYLDSGSIVPSGTKFANWKYSSHEWI